MKYKISKELFEAVMGSYSHFGTLCNREFDCIIDNEILYYEKYNGNNSISINDFFFKCKEWALKQGYTIYSYDANALIYYNTCIEPLDYSLYDYDKHIEANSEQQAIFDACQWIVDNKDK